jgi:hypothetical protein
MFSDKYKKKSHQCKFCEKKKPVIHYKCLKSECYSSFQLQGCD